MRLSRTSGSLAIALLLGSVIGAMTSGSASAATAWPYCGWQVAPYSPCSQVATSPAIYLNMAHYPGAGTVRVCERVITLEGENTISRRCDNNTVDSVNDLAPYPVAVKRASVGNDSPWKHTINGIVWTP